MYSMGVQAKPSQAYKKIKKELINPANMSAAGTPILIAIFFLDYMYLANQQNYNDPSDQNSGIEQKLLEFVVGRARSST